MGLFGSLAELRPCSYPILTFASRVCLCLYFCSRQHSELHGVFHAGILIVVGAASQLAMNC